MDEYSQMSNVSEIAQNEPASACQISQNEASSEASEPSSPKLSKTQRCFKRQAEKDAKEKAYEEVFTKANATTHVSPTPTANIKK